MLLFFFSSYIASTAWNTKFDLKPFIIMVGFVGRYELQNIRADTHTMLRFEEDTLRIYMVPIGPSRW